jgi:hypothetical protein
MSKLGTLLLTKENKPKQVILLPQEYKRKTLLQEKENKRKHKQNKNTVLPPVKLYIHIERMHTLFLHDDQVS